MEALAKIELDEHQPPTGGFKKTDLGTFPDDWELVSLGKLGQTLIGLTYSPRDVSSDGVLVLRSSRP